MSGVKLNTAGGGSVVVQPASSIASDVTVNVPSQNCTLGIQGPAFSAYQSSLQSISTGTWTKVQLQSEEFDTATCFDSATNYRFTPNVSGYYQVSGSVRVGGFRTQIQVSVYKNGSQFKDIGTDVATYSAQCNGSALIYFNGTTDYAELYCWLGGGQSLTLGVSGTYFQAALVRAA